MAAEPTSSNPWWRLYLPALIGMLVTVFLSLALSTYFAAKRSGPVVDMSKRISDIAIPSVLHLSALRGHLRTLERQMRVGAAGEPLDLDALRVATQDIDSESGVYGELRHSPAERERWDATSRSIVSLLDKVETLRYQRTHASTLGTESFLAARGEATSALENVRELINLHTRDAQDAAVRIEQVEHLYTTLSSGLTVLTVIVFLVVAATAARLIRRHVLMEQVRISELELFASRVAHDIRGPLGPVLFALQPTSASQLDDATSRSIARGSRAAHRIVDIVDGLYEFAMAGARPTVGVTCDLQGTIGDVVDDVMSVARAPIDIQHIPDRSVACSRGVLESILSNLLRNAVKYTGHTADPRITLRAHEQGEFIVIDVEDNGPGLVPEVHARIFEPYVRAASDESDGIGLGLATVKRLTVAHGGGVGVRSSETGGSTFWVTLPSAA